MNKQVNSSGHSTRPARIYTAKLTSGNLKQFFFNNNTAMPSGKQLKHKNYSPKASNHLKKQRQNNLLLSNEHGYLPNAASGLVAEQQ